VFQPNEIETAARQRQEDLLHEAEQLRLIELLSPQPSGCSQIPRKAKYWVGGQMIKWGLKLKGQTGVYENGVINWSEYG
jgi:hypothetical protein